MRPARPQAAVHGQSLPVCAEAGSVVHVGESSSGRSWPRGLFLSEGRPTKDRRLSLSPQTFTVPWPGGRWSEVQVSAGSFLLRL